jgi:YtxH-like protein
MSYAGPASRTSRAPKSNSAMELIREPVRLAAPPSGHSRSVRSARRSKSYTDDGRRAPVFMAGLAVGLAVGAGVALLFAPRTGSEARHAIGRMTGRLGRRGHDAWDDLGDEFRRYRRYRRRSRSRREASSL